MYLRVHFYAAMYLLYQSRGGLATEAAGRARDVCRRVGRVYPVCCVGAFLHVGKNATFGLGRYKILHGMDISKEGRAVKKC